MRLAILANEAVKQEWLGKGEGNLDILWVNNLDELAGAKADAYFDMMFEEEPGHIVKLSHLMAPVFINSVIEPLLDSELLSSVTEECQLIRINSWPTFLKRDTLEIAIADPFDETIVHDVLGALNWKWRIVPDVPGMITPRVIAMIINEAYFTLQANVSTKAEIDIAMKLGTNYPYGPFEWSEMIGLKKIHSLLQALTVLDKRYEPCALLQSEAA
jgi:3-hydroxybutyryl-CoA dehydrogenase